MNKFQMTIAALALTAFALPDIAAAEYNQRPHLAPSVQAKVSRVIAKSWQRRNKSKSYDQIRSGKGCGDQIIGDFRDNDRMPREVIIVTRDVININRNCRQ